MTFRGDNFDDYFDKQFDKQFDENLKKATRWARVAGVVSLVLSLGVATLVIWALITLVNWVVTK